MGFLNVILTLACLELWLTNTLGDRNWKVVSLTGKYNNVIADKNQDIFRKFCTVLHFSGMVIHASKSPVFLRSGNHQFILCICVTPTL